MVLTVIESSGAGQAVQENPTTGEAQSSVGGTPTKEPLVLVARNAEQPSCEARGGSSDDLCETRGAKVMQDSFDNSDSDSDSEFVLPPGWYSTAGLMPSFFMTKKERRLERKLVKQQKRAEEKEERRKKAEAEKSREELLKTLVRCYPGTFGAPKRPRNLTFHARKE